jgi:hypothetical protein
VSETSKEEVRIPVKPTPPPPANPDEFVRLEKVEPLQVENPGLVRRMAIPVSCAQCGSRMERSATASPFKDGPFKGGFFCNACWTLFLDEHPEILADRKSREWVEREARSIRLKRAGNGGELLFGEGESRAYLTPRGTVILDLKRLEFGGPDEYDSDRFQTFIRIFLEVSKRVAGFSTEASGPDFYCGKCRGPVKVSNGEAVCGLCKDIRPL